MILTSPGAEAFSIFGLTVYRYGIIMAFAILIGAYAADWAYRKYFLVNENNDLLLDLMPWLIIVGFAGARIYYCILNYHYYLAHPLSILNVREGGLSIHGTLLACIIFLIVYAKKKGIKLFNLTAPLVLGLALAQSIGRWGNFFNSEAFGKPLESGFIKLFIPEALRPLQYRQFEYFHPAFLCPFDAQHKAEDYVVRFSQPETPTQIMTGQTDGLVTGEKAVYFEQQTEIPMSDEIFAHDSICFTDLKSARMSLVEKDTGKAVNVEVTGFPYVLLWSAAGPLHFVCIEPWMSLPDARDADGEWTHKPCAAVLSEGEQYEVTLSMEFAR